MKIIEKLKEETRELHEQIEDKNLARQIMDHSIDLTTYKLLLLQNYLAYRETETEIQKFLPHYEGKKHQQLKQDLQQLGITEEIPSKNGIFECHSKAEALGAAYVVEGSALGGMVLAKNLQKCAALDEIPRHYFFNGDKNNMQDWKAFKEELENYPFTPSEEKMAIEKAKDTFRFFERIFDRELNVDLNPTFKHQRQ
ncbi:biliverdin-producing heme oxygenase [Salinimicrobium sp. MT39]|uniref:Biliverdin-producing heme oxygenase n=1 Tax=Salinimicrobium profundisediminis TaxID=2994553 RepID=A0A9X3CZH8_9FLAO|nr:biliverdin-producing heme oxygenase [Salinimicrobium profundisediminis]MCX2839549.1 biliverdin-producing heme oxygenase [Salinimicrobium profundisediminis]